MFRAAFEYGPLAFLALTMLVGVLPAGFRARGQAVSAMALLVAFSKFICFRELGGDSFEPALPQAVIWGWNLLYSSAVILMALACLWLPAALFLRGRPRVRRAAFLALAAASLLIGAKGVWNGVRAPRVREVELDFPDLPPELDGYRIAHLTDLHVSSAARRWRTAEVVRRANAAGADLIVVTGDLEDGMPDTHGPDVAPLGELRAPDGVWHVTGNHDCRNRLHWSVWAPFHRRSGIRFLHDECVFPRPQLALGGVDDLTYARVESGYAASVRKTFAAATNGEFRVLLSHRPGDFAANVRSGGVRLQLSGHTHGGVAPGMDLVVARCNGGFVHGLYRIGRSVLSVSRGAGQWAGFPIRLFNDSEIPVCVLRRR